MKCNQCEKELKAHQKKYCSRKCEIQGRTLPRTVCGFCKKEFPRRQDKGKVRPYCSQQCYFSARALKYKQATNGKRRCCSCKLLLDPCVFSGLNRKCNACASKEVSIRIKNMKHKVLEFLGGKCVKCGYSRCYGSLHLHHPNPALKNITWGKVRSRSWETIRKWIENEKVEIICANCHGEEHWGINSLPVVTQTF
jgi:hypothetical protein